MGTMESLVLANHHRCLYESALWVRLITSKKALDSGRSPEGGGGWGMKAVDKGSKVRDLLRATSTVTQFRLMVKGESSHTHTHTHTHTQSGM